MESLNKKVINKLIKKKLTISWGSSVSNFSNELFIAKKE